MVTVDNVYIFKKEVLHRYCFELNIFCGSAILPLLYNRFPFSIKIFLYLCTHFYLKISHFFLSRYVLILYNYMKDCTMLLFCLHAIISHGRVPFIFELYYNTYRNQMISLIDSFIHLAKIYRVAFK